MALLNLLYPFGDPLHRLLLAVSAVMLLVHVAEVLLFDRRLKNRPLPWLERLLVLLFGILHLRSTR